LLYLGMRMGDEITTFLLTTCISSADKTVKVWDLGARAAVSTMTDTQEIWAVSWQPSSAAASSGGFVTGCEDGVVRWAKAAGTG
jgi:WD repeat-containing protein 61